VSMNLVRSPALIGEREILNQSLFVLGGRCCISRLTRSVYCRGVLREV
jgi:hypothetical protein